MGTIQDNGHILKLTGTVNLFQIGQHTAVEAVGADNEDRQVGNAVGDSRIGNDTYRHVVDNDIVVLLAQRFDHGFQTFAEQQFCRIRSYRSCRNDIQVFYQFVVLDDF